MTTFTYKCTNCHTANKTTNPPDDSMLHCSRCGYLTVQYFHQVSGKVASRATAAREKEKP